MRHSKHRFRGSIGLVTIGVALAGCAPSTEVGEVEPVTFDDLDHLFEAVDDELECPEVASNEYGIAIPNHDQEFLHGRSCGHSVVMAHSDDPSVITEIQNQLATVQGGPIPMVHNTNWLVIDITEVAADGQAVSVEHPGSRDLESLAVTWGAAYSEF